MANLHGLTRFDPRRRRRFVADNEMDDSPVWAPFFARPWVTPPSKEDKGAFGVDSNGLISSVPSNGASFMPVSGQRRSISFGLLAGSGPLAYMSGSIIYINAGSGTVTLPPLEPGMFFDFRVIATVAGATKVITSSASEFLHGYFVQSTDGTFVTASHAANGTTTRSINLNGSTTGGIIGDEFSVYYMTATKWLVVGRGSATGTEATPFGTS